MVRWSKFAWKEGDIVATVQMDVKDLEALRRLARMMRDEGQHGWAYRIDAIVGRDVSDDVQEDW